MAAQEYEVVDGVKTPVPIAVSGDLKIMPPKTGLPVASGAGLVGAAEQRAEGAAGCDSGGGDGARRPTDDGDDGAWQLIWRNGRGTRCMIGQSCRA